VARNRKIGAIVSAVALSLGALIAPVASFADDRDDLVKQKEEAEQEIESLRSSLEGVDTDLQDTYIKLQETKQQVSQAETDLDNAKSELAESQRAQEAVAAQLEAAQGELQSIRDQIDQDNQKLEEAQSNLGEIARAQYRGENVPSTLDLLFGSKSTEDFQNAYAAAQAITRTEDSTLAKIEQIAAQNRTREARQADVEQKISDLKDQADDLVEKNKQLTAAAQTKRNKLVSLQSTYQKQSKALESKKADFEESIQAAQKEASATQAQIDQIDAENAKKAAAAAKAQAAAQANTGSTQTNTGTTSSSYWLKPVVAAPFYVTSAWGYRIYPFTGTTSFHAGVDISSACGAPQYAPADGVIAKVIPAAGNSTHGNQIYINLGTVNGSSWVVVTNHLSAFNVSVGQSVKQGDIIGWTGATGKVTGCHVHMEVWKDGVNINPETLPGFTRSN
jgi:murein DD-endopeptidase MepM/ murein hydrolase activator NlpD